MKTAKLFQNGQSQAIRLPKEFRFSGSEVYIHRQNNAVVVFSKDGAWEEWRINLNRFSDDFMTTREQPAIQRREGL